MVFFVFSFDLIYDCLCLLTLDYRFAPILQYFRINKITEEATELYYVFGVLINKIYCSFLFFRVSFSSFVAILFDYYLKRQNKKLSSCVRDEKKTHRISVYNLRDSFFRWRDTYKCTLIHVRMLLLWSSSFVLSLILHLALSSCILCWFRWHWRFIFNLFVALFLRLVYHTNIQFAGDILRRAIGLDYMLVTIVNIVTAVAISLCALWKLSFRLLIFPILCDSRLIRSARSISFEASTIALIY